MAKSTTEFVCSECGWSGPKWVGKCPACQEWGTVAEFRIPAGGSTAARGSRAGRTPLAAGSLGAAFGNAAEAAAAALTAAATPITDVPSESAGHFPTGVDELDRVLGGGLVPGAVVLVAGEPGVGKSTLLLDVAAKKAADAVVLYASGEESATQVKMRADRIGALSPNLHLLATTDVTPLVEFIYDKRPALVVVDSVQTIASIDVDGAAGGVAQVRAITQVLITAAKTTGTPILLVGHVTKDGSIAGPRALEHLVDVVCQFEGDRHSRLRLVRAVKNRYGATDEVGCFELIDSGIRGLADPSGLFLSSRNVTVPGTCVSVSVEGKRPMPVEVQALAVPASGPPRRTTSGVDSSRVAIMVAVLQSRLGLDFDRRDIFVSTIGGARATEPANDIAIALALTSAQMGMPIAPGVVAVGEVSLTGELRPALGMQQRINEAARLGFTTVIVPSRADGLTSPAGIRVVAVDGVVDAARAVLPLD